MSERLDLAIIGAGPAGLACGVEARRAGLDFLILEKGCLVNSIYRFPVNMTFFTTAELLEIGDIPMVVSTEKPKRSDGLRYYRRVADHYRIPFRDFETVEKVEGRDEAFTVVSRDRWGRSVKTPCRKVIVATGYFDNPNFLGVPGEDLSKVSHYYDDPHPYFRKKVAVVGGKNSAAIAALELYRNGAEVTLIHRGESMGREVKYWILPDINNRIRNGEIAALFSTRVLEVHERWIVVQAPTGVLELENDFVLALTGYHPDQSLLSGMGIQLDPETLIPTHDPETLETNVAGIFIAGSIISGRYTNRLFIENGRFHGQQIIPALFRRVDQDRKPAGVSH